MLVVGRFRVDDPARDEFVAGARCAVAVLAEQAGCTGASLGQSTDDANLFVIRSEWSGVGAYRRALSSFDVKMIAIPLLSTAIDEPSAYELVDHWTPDGQVVAASGLAADADEVGLGHAAGPEVRSVTK
jgi:quinol monooxygenase YgiN